jgi:hypothetical protein
MLGGGGGGGGGVSGGRDELKLAQQELHAPFACCAVLSLYLNTNCLSSGGIVIHYIPFVM